MKFIQISSIVTKRRECQGEITLVYSTENDETYLLGKKQLSFPRFRKSAKHASLIYSLIETCKMNAVKPVKYLERVFNEIANGATNYEALLPMNLVKQQ